MMMCCCGGKVAALCSIVPTALLLTVSFFVLVVLRKIQEQGLKVFGYVIVALLWLGAITTFSAGIYVAAKGRCPMMLKMQRMKCAGMGMPVGKDKTHSAGEQESSSKDTR